jgi:hydroxymethylglutaryl-CoA lyase
MGSTSNLAITKMGDNAQVFQGIDKYPSTTYTVLVPNLKGLEQAILAGVNEVALFIAASETFSKKNTNCTIEESLKRVDELMPICKEKNIKVRGYISCVMGCPYEGDIDPSVVNTLTHELLNRGCYEISLGDTIGIGTPGIYFFPLLKSFLIF